MRKLVIGFLVFSLLVVFAVWQRHRLLLSVLTPGEPIPHVTDALPVPGGVVADDGHFSVVQLDETTFAIAEPYSWARNVNYLVLGDDRALLFDAGVGHYDIRPVVRAITDLPLIFMPSHFHYDHTGQGKWANVALVDIPHVRDRAQGNQFSPNWGEHLGTGEAIELPVWDVTEWVAPNDSIDLGGRELVLLYTPGHTDNSVSLLDVERQLMFTGDFFTSSPELSSLLPTARLGDYLQSADKVLLRTQALQQIIFRGAHAGIGNDIPNNSRLDLQTFRDQLQAIRAGTLQGQGVYPVAYRIHESLVLNAEPKFLQNWTPSYPDDHPVH